MPTVLIFGPHRFFFFSREDNEPPHVHVETAEDRLFGAGMRALLASHHSGYHL